MITKPLKMVRETHQFIYVLTVPRYLVVGIILEGVIVPKCLVLDGIVDVVRLERYLPFHCYLENG